MSSTSLILEVKPRHGAMARDCCEDAVRMASALGVTVRFKHNGVVVLAEPDSIPDKLHRKWLTEFNRADGIEDPT